MSDLVGNPEDRFSRVAAQIVEKRLFCFLHMQKQLKCTAGKYLVFTSTLLHEKDTIPLFKSEVSSF